MDSSSRNSLQHTKLHRKLRHIRGQGRNHEFFRLPALSDPPSGHPRSHSTRTTSPQLPLLPPGALDDVDSECLSGWLKSRLRDAVTGYRARQHRWLVLVLGAC